MVSLLVFYFLGVCGVSILFLGGVRFECGLYRFLTLFGFCRRVLRD